MRIGYSLIALTGGLLLSVSTAGLAASQDVDKQLDTVHTHANLAMQADSVDAAHMHLHHVINCLVPPDDAAFDADEANPCDGMGSGYGALSDTKDTKDVHAALEDALSTAKDGLDAMDLDDSQAAGGDIADKLETIQ